MPRKLAKKLSDDDLMLNEPADGKLRLELRRLSNSEGWVKTTREASENNSNLSTPLQLSPDPVDDNTLNCDGNESGKKKRGRPKAGEQPRAPSKFKMVLEKDDDFEIDYVSPDDDDDNSSLSSAGVDHCSGEDFFSPDDDISDDDCQSANNDFSFLSDDDEDEEDIPELKLPQSSDDLLIPNELLLPALAVYEVLRHFRRPLRLSPMLFEDFCAAVVSCDTNILMNECHITLLKALLREEEQSSTIFAPLDQKDSSNAAFFFIDHLTWPEVLRSFIESLNDHAAILEILEESDFPLVTTDKKLQVLQLLTDLYVSSAKIRDQLMMDGTIQYDDHCRACHKLGDLLCCETCSAVYHLACCNPPLAEVPDDEWQCEICSLHKLNGLSNCENLDETMGQYLRHEPVGVDRHGRKYWFLVRRIIVESEDNVYYYSTTEEFNYLLTILDPMKYEMVLCEAMKSVEREFPLQARITEQITDESKWEDGTQTCLTLIKERVQRMIEDEEKQRWEQEKRMREEEAKEEEKLVEVSPVARKDDAEEQKMTVEVNDVDTEQVAVKNETVEETLCDSKEAAHCEAAIPTTTSTDIETSSTTTSTEITAPSTATSAEVLTSSTAIGAEVATPSTPTSSGVAPLLIKTPTISIPKIQLNFQPKTSNQAPPTTLLMKSGQLPASQHKLQPCTSLASLKNLYVVRDGVRTPITLGPGGRLLTTPKILVLNQQQQQSGAQQQQPQQQPQQQQQQQQPSRMNRELRRLQFSAAGPKMQKLTPFSMMEKQEVVEPAATEQVASSVQADIKEEENPTHQLNKPAFRLGEDGGYKQYRNQYVENLLALNKYQHKEDKDRERYLGYKFSLTGSAEFEWIGDTVGSQSEIAHTLRSQLFKFEQQIPLCFMHGKWEQYRKMWGRMLIKNDSSKAFGIVLGILEMAIRTNVKKPVWKDFIGQVRLRRLTTGYKDEHEKKKKYRIKAGEDAANLGAVWCKYPLPVHSCQVWKMKGEEYRVTGYGGWMWMSSTRHTSRLSRHIPQTVIHVTPPGESEAGSPLVDVSQQLMKRGFRKRWPSSKLDKLLRYRLAQEKMAQENQVTGKDSVVKSEGDGEKTSEVAQGTRETVDPRLRPPPPLAPLTSGTAAESAGIPRPVSRRFRNTRRKPISRDSVCLDKTSEVWKLKKSANTPKLQSTKMPIPWLFSAKKGQRKSIFRLPLQELRYLIVKGGVSWCPSGFHHTQKLPSNLELWWPYPAARPTIGTTWRYKIQHATSFASIAYLLRVLWHSMRWDDMATKPASEDGIHAVHTEEEIVSTELLKRRDLGYTGLRSEYFIRRITMTTAECDQEIPRSEAYTPSSRSGLRTRSRPISLRDRSKSHKLTSTSDQLKPKVETIWVSENAIELWQIRQFDLLLREQQKKLRNKFIASLPLATPPSTPTTSGKSSESSVKVEKPPADKITSNPKNINISQPLIQQAAALHKVQGLTGPGFVDNPLRINPNQSSLIKLGDQTSTKAGGVQKITIRAPFQSGQHLLPIKATSGGLVQGVFRTQPGHIFMQQGGKLLPKPIIIKQGPGLAGQRTTQLQHPTVRLAATSNSQLPAAQHKSNVHIPVTTPSVVTTGKVPTPLPPTGGKLVAKQTSNMQVKLSATQLSQLMKADNDAVVSVAIKLSDGTPGIGRMQVLPPGKQVQPSQGQQVMQCKVGNEIRKFLLTAATHAPATPTRATDDSPAPPVASVVEDNEVSVAAPSLRDRIEQLQQRHPDLLLNKHPTSTDIRRLMSDKDPLWGGSASRSQTPPTPVATSSKKQVATKQVLDDDSVMSRSSRKKQYSLNREEKEEQQRKTVVQQIVKSLLDRIERREELEARRRKKERIQEMQKRKRMSLDEQKSHQRMQSRLTHALKRHEELLKQEIRKRKIITEKYLTRIIQNELYNDTIVSRAALQQQQQQQQQKQQQQQLESRVAQSMATKRSRVASTEVDIEQPPARKRRTSNKRPSSPPPVVEPTPPSPKKKKMISTKLYCICKTPYDDARFYIGCDLCMNWFHGSCVGISERRAKKMDTWTCDDCRKQKPQVELYCLCRTPYDDAQFYIGCDACQDWFHGSCVGMSEEEAATLDSYTCPRCRQQRKDAAKESQLSDRDYFNLTKIVRHLQSHKMSWPFLEPVREVDAPGYYKVVKRPMDLQTVMKRLKCRFYMKLSELVGDVSLIFDNCRQFNGCDSRVVRCAEIVETVFVGKIRDLRGR